ncbi:FadR/GntR family transcriptional regulator [Methylocella sp.]|uniref:FadR/GntR family transcriptional regulator n=1 Tax=Methylocella sp. TaxID=1978226 RepID=UPI0037840EA0
MTTHASPAEPTPACFRPVEQTRSTKAADLVANQIRAAIIRGELAAGDLLPAEPRLIEQFSVSRPTIREAIRILESEDLLVVLRGARGGARVLKPTAGSVSRAAGVALQAQGATLADIYEARLLIEPAAAARAARERPQKTAQALQAQVDAEYDIGDDFGALCVALAEFHRILLAHSGSQTLALLGVVLQSLVERHQALVEARFDEERADARARLAQIVVAAQQKLIDLIAAGEAEEAERHWRRHMEAARGFWLAGGEGALVNLID